jgi:hypothetical protein
MDMARVLVKPEPGGKSVWFAQGEARTKAIVRLLESLDPHCREKPLSDETRVSVPQTDTGR